MKQEFLYDQLCYTVEKVMLCIYCIIKWGEFIMNEFLKNNNFNFKYHYYNKDCKNPKTNFGLYFDFFIPEIRTFIEIDGTQHYYKTKYWDKFESLESRQYRDNIKNKWCKKNNYKLIRLNPNKFKKYNNQLLNIINNSSTNTLIKLL